MFSQSTTVLVFNISKGFLLASVTSWKMYQKVESARISLLCEPPSTTRRGSFVSGIMHDSVYNIDRKFYIQLALYWKKVLYVASSLLEKSSICSQCFIGKALYVASALLERLFMQLALYWLISWNKLIGSLCVT